MNLEQAKQRLADMLTNEGGLYDPSRYTSYSPGDSDVTLDGAYTADELEAIVVLMRSHEAT